MSTYIERINDARNNPALMLDVVYNELESQLEKAEGDYDVPIAGAPFPWALENATLLTCVGMDENQAILQKVYPSLAKTDDDLYRHMSDRDYLGRFSQPAPTSIQFIMSRDEVLSKVVDVPGTRIKRLVIPRLTSVTVGGYTFTMQYPIYIELMPHGGLQITYNNDKPSPITTLTSNMVHWDTVSMNNRAFIMMDVPVHQMKLTTKKYTINAAAGFNGSYGFEDHFFHARVFISQNGGWLEINTTHSDQVYDHRRLTAVLKVSDKKLHVEIPPIYFSLNMVRGEIRVDLYTTKGEIDVDLASFDVSQFETTFNPIDDEARYIAPLRTFNDIQAISRQRVSGGTAGLTFTQLRNQVVYNTLAHDDDPITYAQLNASLERRGYRVVNVIDNTTDRQFIAIRSLPTSNIPQLNSTVGSVMGTFQNTLLELSSSNTVLDNGERITVLPTSLYEYSDGRTIRLPDNVYQELMAMPIESRISRLNQRRYLFSPFHYVLDGTRNDFDVRPYLLTSPTVSSQVFVDANASTEMQIGIDGYSIEHTDTGYRLLLSTRSGDRVKEIDIENIVVQLGYIPQNERTYASVNGTLMEGEEGERLVEFNIETNFDINADDYIRTLNMSMFDENQRDFFTPLEGAFDVTFIILNQDMRLYDPTEMDNVITSHLLPEDTDKMVVSRERLTINFGSSLRNLWRNSRTVPSDQNYRRYTSNVPAVYSETVIERDQDGVPILTMDGDGNVDYNTIHERGEPILDQNGEVVYRHLVGDPVLGDNNEPILVEPRSIKREYTLMLLDGLYMFATDARVINYRNQTGEFIRDLLENDIEVFQANLRERTELYLHPTTTFGDTTIEVNQDQRRSLSLSQSIGVEYYLTPSSYSNTQLRTAITEMTHRVISQMLEEETVSSSAINARLREEAGNGVMDVKVTGLGGNDASILSVTDQSSRLTIGKRAVALPNMEITIQDDLDILFLRHG